MNISRFISGVAALTFFAGVALAEPPKPSHESKVMTPVASAQIAKQSNDNKAMAKTASMLSDKQMDTVSAGMVYSIDGVCCYSFNQVPWAFVAKIQIYQ